MTWKDDPLIFDEYDKLAPTPRSAAPPIPVDHRPRRRRRTRGKTRCLLVFLLAAGLLLATRLSQLWLVFDVLNQFTLQFAIVAVAFLIGYFMPFGRVLTGMLLTIAGMAATGLYPQYFSDKPQIVGSVQANEKELRLFSFNSRLYNDNAEAVADEILRIDPDIAVLIEFGEEKRVALDRLRPTYPHVAGCMSEPYCHLAIISKIPIASSEARAIWTGPPLIRATLGGEFAGMVVVGVHTISGSARAGSIHSDQRACRIPLPVRQGGDRHGRLQRHAVLAPSRNLLRPDAAQTPYMAAQLAGDGRTAATRHRPHLRQSADAGDRAGTHRPIVGVRSLPGHGESRRAGTVSLNPSIRGSW